MVIGSGPNFVDIWQWQKKIMKLLVSLIGNGHVGRHSHKQGKSKPTSLYPGHPAYDSLACLISYIRVTFIEVKLVIRELQVLVTLLMNVVYFTSCMQKTDLISILMSLGFYSTMHIDPGCYTTQVKVRLSLDLSLSFDGISNYNISGLTIIEAATVQRLKINEFVRPFTYLESIYQSWPNQRLVTKIPCKQF